MRTAEDGSPPGMDRLQVMSCVPNRQHKISTIPFIPTIEMIEILLLNID